MSSQADVDLIQAWVADLKTFGYTFPEVRKSQDKSVAGSTEDRAFQIQTPAMWHRYDAIVLVIMFNKPQKSFISIYETLRKAYRPIFRRIVYTGSARPDKLPPQETWIECDGLGGSYQHVCFFNVIQVR